MSFLEQLNPEQIEVEIRLAEVPQNQDRLESELDEMWSYVAKKENQRWLWHALLIIAVEKFWPPDLEIVKMKYFCN